MPKKIEYVSNKLVRKLYRDFRDNQLSVLKRSIIAKYEIHFSEPYLSAVSAEIFSSLNVSLYLECARYRDFPSFRHQLLLIHDFKQLLENTKPEPKYAHISDYSHCYDGINIMLSERAHYVEAGVLSQRFFKDLSLSKENFPMELAEKYLDYTEEMTRAVIEAMTNMVLEQIYVFFPSEGPAFYRSLFPEALSAATVDYSAENSQVGRRVTFSA
jgi:hypothetical protein